MSATVEEVAYYEATCGECSKGSGPEPFEDWAEEWAANHNATYHEADNSNDDDYDKFKGE